MGTKHCVCERANVNDESGLHYSRHASILLPYLDSLLARGDNVTELEPSVKSL